MQQIKVEQLKARGLPGGLHRPGHNRHCRKGLIKRQKLKRNRQIIHGYAQLPEDRGKVGKLKQQTDRDQRQVNGL